ncbi:hypothetical protein ES703_111561 [subsurface metagenome]
MNLLRIPSFDEIHELNQEEMVKLYFITDPQLQGFLDDLLEDIREKYPSLSMRVEGPPGWGKTSFFYYMSAIVNNDNRFPRYIHIMNATSFASFDGIEHDTMIEKCLAALEYFFEDCCSDSSLVHEIQERDDRDDRWKVNFYIDYIHKHQGQFNKSLIIVLDGVDTIPEKYVGEISIELFNILSTTHIIKWLAIRDIVFKSYSDEIRKCLRTHFPHRREFPRVPLYGIINKRVKSCGTQPRNPFSKALCYVIQNFSEGDNRIGLAILKDIMNKSHPRELGGPINKSTIQELFEKKSINVILENGLIPNIFKSYANVNSDIPLAKEVFSLLTCLQHIDESFCEFISVSISSKLSKVLRKTIDVIKINQQDIKDAAAFLVREKLASVILEEPLTAEITKKGELTMEFIDLDIYINACRENIDKSSLEKKKQFWDIASQSSDFQDVVREKLYGDV